MSGNQPESNNRTPLQLGLGLAVPISSEVGSASLLFAQPLLTSTVYLSSMILIVSEIVIFIAKQFFEVESLPIIDASNGQTVQMPLNELQEFLRWMANGSGASSNSITTSPNSTTNARTILQNTDGQIVPALITPTTAEAPLVFSLVISTDYALKPWTPSLALFVPLLTFPGIRGALPIVIVGLLATIFTRAVVPPESTGSRPLATSGSTTENSNNPLTFTTNDLLQMLTKFGKHFSPK